MPQVCVISIYVSDMGEALDFYENVLGFEVSKQYGPKIVSLVHDGLPVVLEENAEAGGGSGMAIALKTDNVYKAANDLLAHGVELLMPEPADCPPGKYISFKDPFGNTLEYLQFME